jgi:hypothetical protein
MKNGKKIIVFVLLMLCYSGAGAQRFQAGVLAGFVASDVYGADIVPDSDAWNNTDFRKAGIMLGGSVSTSLGKRTLLEMEINYIQKGTQQAGDSTGYGFYKFSFHYVEVPLLLNYRLQLKAHDKTTTRFELHAGISAGQLVKTKAQGNNFYTVNDYSYLHKTDISLLAGIGYHFFEHLHFSFRYSNSLIPVFKRSNSPIFFAQSLNVGNSLVLQFILQYVFSAGKAAAAEIGN